MNYIHQSVSLEEFKMTKIWVHIVQISVNINWPENTAAIIIRPVLGNVRSALGLSLAHLSQEVLEDLRRLPPVGPAKCAGYKC